MLLHIEQMLSCMIDYNSGFTFTEFEPRLEFEMDRVVELDGENGPRASEISMDYRHV